MKCQQCLETFAPSREWQVFCSKQCKNKYHNERRKCFYCGYTATTKDHIYPISKRFPDVDYIERHRLQKRSTYETVPACWECNKILGSQVFDNIEKRLLHLARRYIKKYPKNKPEKKLSHIAEVLERYGVQKRETQRQLDLFEMRCARALKAHRERYGKSG